MNYLLYNELGKGGTGKDLAVSERLRLCQKGMEIPEENLLSLLGMDPKEFFSSLREEDAVVIYGGDGTLNHLINNLGEVAIPCPLYLCPTGNGTDFQRDLPKRSFVKKTRLYRIDEFLKNLPFVEAKGQKYHFINGVGFGIDGESCVKVEQLKAIGEKSVSYSKVAVKLLFGPYAPSLATIRLDEEEPFQVERTFMATTMNSRYIGGGVILAPKQRRTSGYLTFVCIHGKNRLKMLGLLRKARRGQHIKDEKRVFTRRVKKVEVSFDRPCGLEIDGETLTGVTEYKVYFE